jgi:hypothetical protein
LICAAKPLRGSAAYCSTLNVLVEAPVLLEWTFPLPRTHTGALLGNGVQGLMVWGDEALHITVGRAGFWDHRGGNLFASRTTYAEVRALLEAGDEAGLRRVFARPDRAPGTPEEPTQIGGGRVELRFPGGFSPTRATLDLASATLRVSLADERGNTGVATVRQAMGQELAWVELDAALGRPEVTLVPTWRYVGEELAAVGVSPPEPLDVPEGGGFIQRLPEDEPLALAWTLRSEGRGLRAELDRGEAQHPQATPASSQDPLSPQPSVLVIATALGDDAAARATALATGGDTATAGRGAEAWWADYWAGVPRVAVPDAVAQEAWDYGLYKLAGLTTPGGVAATLQGPWIEEYQIPPWSNDYHFNINVQMIYLPCLMAGRFDHLWPMWEMLMGWQGRMLENGGHFFGAGDALLMPHAVDDRCAAVGSFWTGMIDQACSAWMAQLAWLHYRHSLDERVLREVAWPLLTGAFNGYWAMLEPHEGRLSLPVSVSPEYNGAQMNAWGRDASFQLAALHFLADALPKAAALLGRPEDARWARVRAEVPPYTLAGPADKERIGLWEGQDLDESHRHHAHLGAIYPFCTVDPADPAHAEAVRNTFQHWIKQGAGLWSGWCVPWASTLCARAGMPDAAVQWLHWWRDVFVNEGRGTLHNAAFPGHTLIWGWPRNPDGTLREIMQMDAGLGALSAVQELLLQQRGDAIALLPGVPERWRDLRFDDICTEGGFRIGATREAGRTSEVRVRSTAGGRLVLRHGIAGAWSLNGERGEGPTLERDTAPGEELVLRAL